MKGAEILFLAAATLSASPILIVPGIHPNYDVALPANLTNDSGITPEELSKWAPQFDFVFSGNLIGYFSPNLPWELPIWTVRLISVPPAPDLQFGPVTEHPIIIETPDDSTDSSTVPEAATWMMALIGARAIGIKKWVSQ